MITFREFAEHLDRSAKRVDAAIADIVIVVANRAVLRAQELIGKEQEAQGIFPAWEPLSTATLDGFRHSNGTYIPGKIELGYAPPDNPLRRTGGMADSIQFEADGNTGVIGSADKTMLWQEMGTPGAEYPIPARPVLARAMMDAVPDIQALGGEAAVDLLVPAGEGNR